MVYTVKVGIYTLDVEKAGNVITISAKNPGGREVARGTDDSVKAAAENAAAMTQDEGARLALYQTVFPEWP